MARPTAAPARCRLNPSWRLDRLPTEVAMICRSGLWPCFAALIVAVAPIVATAVEPGLGSITPYGVQRGTDVEMVFGGGRLADAKEILFYSPGFTVKSLEAT